MNGQIAKYLKERIRRMNDVARNDLEIASKTVVMQSARQFAETMSDTPQFKEFEQSYFAYRQDEAAQMVLQEFQKKQASLQAVLMLNAVSDEDRQELQRLHDRFYSQTTVMRYIKAQEVLIAISQEVGDLLSNTIGLDFGASCKTGGCCG
jgi:cell fate (sporulation/competence/biofilm development) regulator YlbF (YheA/YmcA/DUF963 family)